jgi:RNA polymerase sigma-70 factor, ECF subfamily
VVSLQAATPRERFAALFSQQAPALYRTALGILGSPQDAADALQEAGLKAFRYFRSLQREEAGAAWLTRVLIHTCYDLGRHRSRLVPVGLEPRQDAAREAPDADWDLVEAVAQLPAEQRTVVILRYHQDLPVARIAEVMQVPEGTVKSRLHAALSKLRTALEPRGREGVR